MANQKLPQLSQLGQLFQFAQLFQLGQLYHWLWRWFLVGCSDAELGSISGPAALSRASNIPRSARRAWSDSLAFACIAPSKHIEKTLKRASVQRTFFMIKNPNSKIISYCLSQNHCAINFPVFEEGFWRCTSGVVTLSDDRSPLLEFRRR